ncbi:MAG: ribosome-associated translation inhibitor RaiA [Helicobacteraceae bacterium]|nr:ribosome-associated translation inhibitor RaiA [Helicobacteraceae bacterium]
MNTGIVARRLELTDAMREYVEKAFEQFGKYNLNIIAVKAIIEDDNKHGKPSVQIEFTIHMAHRDTVVIKHADKDFYAACDLAADRAKKVLRRYKDKISDKIGKETPHKQLEADIPFVYSDTESNEVIETKPDNKMSIQEATLFLRESNQSFLVFIDKDSGAMRVLYWRKDGRFGLY